MLDIFNELLYPNNQKFRLDLITNIQKYNIDYNAIFTLKNLIKTRCSFFEVVFCSIDWSNDIISIYFEVDDKYFAKSYASYIYNFTNEELPKIHPNIKKNPWKRYTFTSLNH